MVATSTEPQPTYSSNSYEETAVETKTRVNFVFLLHFKYTVFVARPSVFNLTLFDNVVPQKKRSRRRSKTKYSVASTDALVESTTNEIVYNKSSSVEATKVSIVEPVHSAGLNAAPEVISAASPVVASDATPDAAATPSANGTLHDHAIVENNIDIDNNNEKLIGHGEQAGL